MTTTELTVNGTRYLILETLATNDTGRGYTLTNVRARRWIKARNEWSKTATVYSFRTELLEEVAR